MAAIWKSSLQVLTSDFFTLAARLGIIRHGEFARLFGSFFSKADDGVNNRLEASMTEHHGFQHGFFRQVLCFGFNHQNRIIGTGNNQI